VSPGTWHEVLSAHLEISSLPDREQALLLFRCIQFAMDNAANLTLAVRLYGPDMASWPTLKTGGAWLTETALGSSHVPASTATRAAFEAATAARARGDYAKAATLYRRAADDGMADAQFYLGLMHANGQGVSQDLAEAVKWYRRAGDQGVASAQFNLGLMFQTGEQIPQDYAEAVRWLRPAAEQGHATAQFNLGVMYGKGQGVSQDSAEGLRWIRKAANGGCAEAQAALARLPGTKHQLVVAP